MWDVASGREARAFSAPGALRGPPAFAPGGAEVAASAGMYDGTAAVWDVATGREVRRLRGHEGGILAVAYSADGRLLAAGGEDGALRLWEAATGQEVCTWQADPGLVCSLAFSPDGQVAASGGWDGSVLLWDVTAAAGAPQRNGDPPSGRDLAAWWDDLAAAPAPRAHRAVWALAMAPQGAGWLGRQLCPVPAFEAGRVRRLVADLDDDDFDRRERATRELEVYAELAEPYLREAVAGDASLEARRRAEGLLELLGPGAPARLRRSRAVAALEYAGTTEARRVLEELAAGEERARLTQEARAALDRLKRRTSARP